MKAVSFQVSKPHQESVKYEKDLIPHFYDKLHYHEDFQLTLINRSSGTLYIGDRITDFNEDDVYLIGKNLPHVFRNDTIYYDSNDLLAESTSLYFTSDLMGKDFFSLAEAQDVKKLLDRSGRGLKLGSEIAKYCKKVINRFQVSSGLDRLLLLIEILNQIVVSGDYTVLSSMGYSKPRKESDNKRINDVFDFIINNFHNEISLHQAAEVANMSPTSFCRYFKNHTRKTFSGFLNEIRIGHACKLLLHSHNTITQVCYESGFNNLSNFNRQFKYYTGYTPTVYTEQRKI